jgi:hypothetical protein
MCIEKHHLLKEEKEKTIDTELDVNRFSKTTNGMNAEMQKSSVVSSPGTGTQRIQRCKEGCCLFLVWHLSSRHAQAQRESLTAVSSPGT